ncbi:hypothetical protein PGN35_029915 [Nodosilinea sp. PGN35]|uniref:hypothetical protein n=1 Tax=unclassified Nodosilinea TaxID=2628167 RepID=UPI000D123863|nr:hypothetical protein [Nodosilinea sp. TSF1-S3]MDF0368408.1 hypothetical protein [Nodosilinea sp. TSF1-S3]PSN11812.1 hypothetical protein C7293_22775 [filamentous cyanobacterium CCT1]PSN78635.1 hypothetical protein C8B47_15840 [filamentous cyanobacterium CCP4]
MTPPRPRTPIPIDRQTQEQIAGTAVLLLERFCRDQARGQRVFEGKQFYTIVERGHDLNIEFRGDAHHLPETILTLRSHQQGGQTFYKIDAWLTQADVQRFALIRQELYKDMGNSQMPSRQTNGSVLN